MWHAFPHLLLMDTTYNTNMYKWPFVQYIGVTSTSKSFCITHAVLLRERHKDFTWALERLKGMLEDYIEPRVIVTDRDSALMIACKQVFPNATRNLCRWHIRENIKKKWKGIYDSEVWDYIHDSWLVRDKEKFVSCWMADRLNFGETTTNRVKSQHANLKRHFNGANNTLHTLAAYALVVIEAQKVQISVTFEHSRIKLKKDHNLQVFYRLHYKVSTKALTLLEKEYGKVEKMTKSGHSCRHQLRKSMGLPCACELEQHLNTSVHIPLKSIDPFWRKLDFDLVVA
ncbi:protein FAR-RED IMPAIRED RESPONSE 1-like [Bidens hawaiensis]|uniref:protein FAR-RED IMPAIRED RESPONSE 1-like n=1 Tax=Bidens hawaiensis TaxID=980011 RepID=UPI00404B665A